MYNMYTSLKTGGNCSGQNRANHTNQKYVITWIIAISLNTASWKIQPRTLHGAVGRRKTGDKSLYVRISRESEYKDFKSIF